MVEYENKELLISHKGEICGKPLTLTVTRICHSGDREESPIYHITGTIHLESTLDVIVICRKGKESSHKTKILRSVREQKNPVRSGTKEVLEKLVRNLQSVKAETQPIEEDKLSRIAKKISKPTYSTTDKDAEQPTSL